MKPKLLLLPALVFLFFSCSIKPEKVEKPNVLFISIDDLNDWIGCLDGHPQIKTPNIDKLAARGILFTNAHTQSPICNPSRTSLLTGLRPSTTGVYGLSPWIRNVDSLKHLVTLPQYFSQNGYTNYSTGKIFHGNNGRGENDHEFDVLGPGTTIKAKPAEKITKFTPGGNHPLMDWGTFPHNDEDKNDFQIASWAVDVLNSKPEDPFFLSCGFFLPHVPVYVTEKWFNMYPYETLVMPPMLENDREDTPRASWYNHWKVPEPRLKWMKESQQVKPLVRSYLAAISFIDSQVGRLLDALDENGFADNTIVVLWSDHGYHLGEKEISGKNTLWERSTHVPLIFAGPGINKNIKFDNPVELLDIYPTLNALCNLPEKSELEGVSLLAELQGKKTEETRPAITTNNYKNHSIRTNEWRYIQYADGSEELYDLAKDPNEWENIASSLETKAIKEDLAKWLPKKNHLPYFGNGFRVLQYENGTPIWEGEIIKPEDAIPDI
ncbi:sulfatase [uncultured Arcticibacterium sp.]|uniref:sulfatase n=1 Tax=uncultured Arcticibacterium sp. TaxID=2173042 RepID=UPI0030FC7F2B